MLLFPIQAVINDPSRVNGLTVGPGLVAWLERVHARPAYQRGIKRQLEEEAKAKEDKA